MNADEQRRIIEGFLDCADNPYRVRQVRRGWVFRVLDSEWSVLRRRIEDDGHFEIIEAKDYHREHVEVVLAFKENGTE